MSPPVQRPAITPDSYRRRLDRLSQVVRERGFAASLVGVGADLEYLTGYRALPLERLTMLVVLPAGTPFLVVPRLERSAAEAGTRTDVEIRTWGETDDPYAVVLDGAGLVSLDAPRIAVSDTLWASHLIALQGRLGGRSGVVATFEVGSSLLRELRMRKDPEEIELLRLAAQAADRVVEADRSGPARWPHRGGRLTGGPRAAHRRGT